MKTRICSSWVLGLVLLVLPLAGCLQENSLSTQGTVAAAAEVANPPDTPTVDSAAETSNADAEEAFAELDEQSISTEPATKVSAEIEVPANLKPSPATAEIIKLANTGVAESVMLSFVTNSLGTFNLRAEEIIYLNDIGIPSTVVTAMIQRDHLLQADSSNVTVASGETAPFAAYQPDAIPEQPINEAEPPTPVFDSGPVYSSADYAAPPDPEPSPTDYTDYYDALAPYGTWVDVQGVGRCWQPTVVGVNHSWSPYFNCGRWVYTDCGWYWMSDYSWGWAPFHYGRWFQHSQLGWCWRPDRVWGPAWVCWRHDADFCGWAPLPPGSRFVAGVGLTFHGHPARHDFSFGLTANHFQFIRTSHFFEHDLARQILPRDHATRIFDHAIASTGIISRGTTVVNNGIPREHVATATRADIRPVSLHNVTPAAGVGIRERFERNGRTLAVFRPDIQPGTPTTADTPSRDYRNNHVASNNGATRASVQSNTRLAYVQPQSPLTTTAPQNPSHTQPPVRNGQPLILSGSEHPRETALAPNSQNPRRIVPLNSLVVIGQHRDSRIAAIQPDNANSRGRTPSYNRGGRYNSAQTAMREEDSRPEIRQPQTPAQSAWWAQPHQPRTSDQQQFRQNRDMPTHSGGNWNATVEQSHRGPSPVHVPEQTHPAPVQSHQPHYAPVESHQSHPAQAESHQSHAAQPESHPVQSAPAPSSSSSSSSSSASHDSSSHSSGHGK
jgi:hypothetical protein